MLDRLLAFLHRPDHDDDAWVHLDALALDPRELKLLLRVTNHGGQETWSRWEVLARGVRDYRIEHPGGSLELHEHGHVLARQFTDTHQELYFRGVPKSPLEVAGQLRAAHHSVSQGWIPFGRYLAPGPGMAQLFSAGDGKLASGPSFLIREYARVLEGAGLRPSALDPHPLRVFSRGQYAASDMAVAALILGRSWFVAEEFEERELLATSV